MIKNKHQERFYRQWIDRSEFIRTDITVEESDILILSQKPVDLNFLKERVTSLRNDIKHYIERDKRFGFSLKPLAVELNAPQVVQIMAKAAELVNVGPMAAVAGSIAQLLAQDLLKQGQRELIIENGGDIFLTRQSKERRICIFAGDSKLSGKLILRIKPQNTPCGICTSSATFGHSLSFGAADSVVVFSESAALADAAATAVCNLASSSSDFKKAIDFAKKVSGILGVLIVIGDKLASWGEFEFSSHEA